MALIDHSRRFQVSLDNSIRFFTFFSANAKIPWSNDPAFQFVINKIFLNKENLLLEIFDTAEYILHYLSAECLKIKDEPIDSAVLDSILNGDDTSDLREAAKRLLFAATLIKNKKIVNGLGLDGAPIVLFRISFAELKQPLTIYWRMGFGTGTWCFHGSHNPTWRGCGVRLSKK